MHVHQYAQPTLKLTKALATNRLASTDQFTMQIHTGGATGPVVNSTANSSTTGSGSTVTAGSGTTGTFTAAAGTTYTLTEAAAGTTVLANYSPVITCTDANGVQTGLPTNAAFSGSLNITPVLGAAIACVLTNTAQPTLSLQKALGAARVNTSDQFTVQIRTGSATGTVVSSTTNATTTGTGSSVTAGTGTTGTFVGSAGTQYFLTEVAASGSLSNYTQTITCTDVNGVQTGLPTNAQFSGSLAITPVSGAVISCTLTNTATVGACSSSVYYIATGTPTQLNSAVYGAGNATFTAIGSTFADNYNPVGYDPVDHYLYGVDSVSNALLRINPTTGVVTTLGLTVPATGQRRRVRQPGELLVAPGTGTTMYEINVATQTIVNTLYAAGCLGDRRPHRRHVPRWQRHLLVGCLVGGWSDPAAECPDGSRQRLHQASFLPNSGAGYGAAWEFGNGNLGLQADNTGTEFQIQIANPASRRPRSRSYRSKRIGFVEERRGVVRGPAHRPVDRQVRPVNCGSERIGVVGADGDQQRSGGVLLWGTRWPPCRSVTPR